MIASRSGPKGARLAPFGLAVVMFLLMPANTGYQERGALTTQAAARPAPARHAVIASPFGTIHAATFSFPRPIGTAIPEPPLVQLASLSTSDLDVTGGIGDRTVRGKRESAAPAPLAFPRVDRERKGDFLASRPDAAAEFGASA